MFNAKVITVSIHKGGEGKTTSTILLSSYLAEKKNHRVCAIDLDSSANLTMALLRKDERVGGSIVDVLLGRGSIKDIIRPSNIENLDIITSTSNMDSFSRVVSADSGMEFRLLDIFDSSGLASMYEYIIIDTPRSLDMSTINAFVASNYFMIPVRCTGFSVKGLTDTLNEVAKIKKRANPNITLLGGYINQFRAHHNLDKTVSVDIEDFFRAHNLRLFLTKVRESVKMREAALKRETIFKYASDSAVAQDCISLCEEAYLQLKSTV
jgi:chromosome partitioning protein